MTYLVHKCLIPTNVVSPYALIDCICLVNHILISHLIFVSARVFFSQGRDHCILLSVSLLSDYPLCCVFTLIPLRRHRLDLYFARCHVVVYLLLVKTLPQVTGLIDLN
jgi:hypothetical protein